MRFKHLHLKQPWPVPEPTSLYLRRSTFMQEVRRRMAHAWNLVIHHIEWAYLEFVYRNKDHKKILEAIGAESVGSLFRNAAPDKSQCVFDQVVASLGEYSDLLDAGTLEWHGWRELPDFVWVCAFVSWVPKERVRPYDPTEPNAYPLDTSLPIFRIFFPTMQVIERDVLAKEDHYEPLVDLPTESEIPESLRAAVCQLTPETERRLMLVTLKRMLDHIQNDVRLKRLMYRDSAANPNPLP